MFRETGDNMSSNASRCVKWPLTLDLNPKERWALGGCYSCCSLLSACGNILVILAILTTRNLRTQSNLLIVNLCIADFFVGCIACPFSTYFLWHEVNDEGNCTFDMALGFFVAFCCSASILLLLLLSIDRYLRIVHFNKFKVWMKGRRIAIAVAFFWVLAATLAALFIVDAEEGLIDLCMVVIAGICFVVMVSLYFLIFRTVAKQSKIIKSHGTSNPPNTSSSVADSQSDNKEEKAKRRKKSSQASSSMRFHMHLAKSFFIINITFFLCWAPFMVTLLLRRAMVRKGREMNSSVYHWCLLIGYLNSALNPIIYNTRNRGIRARIKAIFGVGSE